MARGNDVGSALVVATSNSLLPGEPERGGAPSYDALMRYVALIGTALLTVGLLLIVTDAQRGVVISGDCPGGGISCHLST